MTEPVINGDRLWATLMEMATIGATAKGGNNRLALTDLDLAGRALFLDWAREAGCAITIDSMGNTFARREGSDQKAPSVMSGSHLDTQPTGGRFDGVYGVLAALEAVRAMNDHNIQTRHPIEIVVWTNEEGSRFQPAMMGSGVFAGILDQEEIYQTRDKDGITLISELERHRLVGAIPAAPRPIHAYLEAHIEQGPVLETENREIGVVTGIQGMKWIKATVRGVNAHAGTTPMEVRRDPLVGAAKMVDAIDSIIRSSRPDAVGTVGEFAVGPGSINVINEEVRFSIDLRCPDEGVLEELKSACQSALEEIWHLPPTVFSGSIGEAVEGAAGIHGHSSRRIVSGAGHDAKYLADICPAGMIFIPCEGGISHNEVESITREQAVAGGNVLLSSLVRLAGRVD